MSSQLRIGSKFQQDGNDHIISTGSCQHEGGSSVKGSAVNFRPELQQEANSRSMSAVHRQMKCRISAIVRSVDLLSGFRQRTHQQVVATRGGLLN